MTFFTHRGVACCILLLIGGCARLPAAYQAIQVGKPLDRSILPQHVVVKVEKPDEMKLMEMQQFLLPLGWAERNLTIRRDSMGKVTSLRLEEAKYSYWFVLISANTRIQERTLDKNGQVLEKTEPPLKYNIAITNPWFMVGCFGCWGGAAFVFEFHGFGRLTIDN